MVRDYELKFEQKTINSFYAKKDLVPEPTLMDIEDMGTRISSSQNKIGFVSNISYGKITPSNEKDSALKSLSKSEIKPSPSKQRFTIKISSFSSRKFISTEKENNEIIVSNDQGKKSREKKTRIEPQAHEKKYDMEKEFDKWLEWQKDLWKSKRKQSNNSPSKLMVMKEPSSKLVTSFKKQEDFVINSIWSIIQVNYLITTKLI